MSAAPGYQTLTRADIDNFLEHGYVHLKDCFPPAKGQEWMKDMWTRLGLSPDASHWPIERCNMAQHTRENVKSFAPRVWGAMQDLLGVDRIHPDGSMWSDALIVNLGEVGGDTTHLEPKDLGGWHVDGDFFTHFLDSPEQGLLVVPMFTDVGPGMGPTIGAMDGIDRIAKHLYEHPEGVTPRMTPKNSGQPDDLEFFKKMSLECHDFLEVTGKAGDCYLLHPLTLHTASRNIARIPRVILNPSISLAEPFNFDRPREDDYSLVEKKTLKALGKPEGLRGWKITGKREHVVPARIKLQARLKALELRRLGGEVVDATTDDGLGGKGLNDVNRLEVETEA